MKARAYTLGLVFAAASLAATGCGSDSKSKPEKVAVTVTEAGKQATVSVPKQVKGGLVEFSLDNSAGKAPHEAQLVELGEGHTVQEAFAILGSDKPQPIPDWIREQGGVGTTAPGAIGTATVKLPEGHYAVLDTAGHSGPPPYAEFDVSGENGGDLPSTDAKLTAAEAGTDKYEWQVDGLQAGENDLTFVSEGDKALHHLIAAPIKGDATIDDVKAELDSNSNGPPQTLDLENSVDTPVIDGGQDQVTKLNLKAGRYAFICFLADRDEPDKPHFKEGLLKEVTIGG